MEERVDAYGDEGDHEVNLVADRTPSLLGPMVPKKAVHKGRVLQLQGPAFWKYKKPTFPESQSLFLIFIITNGSIQFF
jgi:hypothetical protein